MEDKISYSSITENQHSQQAQNMCLYIQDPWHDLKYPQ